MLHYGGNIPVRLLVTTLAHLGLLAGYNVSLRVFRSCVYDDLVRVVETVQRDHLSLVGKAASLATKPPVYDGACVADIGQTKRCRTGL